MKNTLAALVLVLASAAMPAAAKSLHELQQAFVDLRFGLFLHFNMPTFCGQDWPDPDAPAERFNPRRLDCRQWARAAKTAGMTYGCLTTKHHSGFCVWDTRTTDYSVMHSPLKRDVVREYADAFRAEGLKVCLYYSILDTHHALRPGMVSEDKVEMVKAQLRELLTAYGPITALIIDGWDAPWSRISYDDVPFEDIYRLVKSLQPECLVMDLNAAKYPREALFYTDIKSYEQEAGQKISPQDNRLPALACLSLQKNWFWKPTFPTAKLKDPAWLVRDNIEPYGAARCNVILNVAPNTDGLLDDNALHALREIGRLWTRRGHVADVPEGPAPVISQNLAKHRPAKSAWAWDTGIMDFANDDDFRTAWECNAETRDPWWSVSLGRERAINMVTLTEEEPCTLGEAIVETRTAGVWTEAARATPDSRVTILRFPTRWADQVRVRATGGGKTPPTLAEVGVYCERR